MRRLLSAEPLDERELAQLYPDGSRGGMDRGSAPSSYPMAPHNRHVVLRDKERSSHAAMARCCASGQAMLPDETTPLRDRWMHGVFAAQLTIGNTSLHKLFSVSRDPYNITRASGLRILIDMGTRLAAAGGALGFRNGPERLPLDLRFEDRTITVHAVACRRRSRDAMADRGRWRAVPLSHLRPSGARRARARACRPESRSMPTRKRFTSVPIPDSLWGQRYPNAAYHLVTSTPDAVEAIGGDELLYADGDRAAALTWRCGRSRPASFASPSPAR